MDEELQKLVRLQEADREIAQLSESLAQLPVRLAAVEKKLEQRKQAVADAEKRLQGEEARRRRLESDIKDQRQKIVKFREQSSSVKTNEQYRALQHEVDFAESEIRRIEDEELAGMLESERLEAGRAAAKEELAAAAERVEAEKTQARSASAKQEAELARLREERAALRLQIGESRRAQYDRIASSSRKTALARASAQRCMACQMALRPQSWNQVRSGELLHCESCGRLLYFDPAQEPGHDDTGKAGADHPA